MSNYKEQLRTVMRCLAADSEQERNRIRAELQAMLDQEFPAAPLDLHDAIQTVLFELGVPDHITGHSYLTDAIKLVVENPDMLKGITTVLYPQVAKAHQTAPNRVERAMRHAIEAAWDRGDLDTLQRFFGYTVSNTKGKPTNSEFIARVANVVRQQMKEAT